MEENKPNQNQSDDLDFTGILNLLKRILLWWERLLIDVARTTVSKWKGILFYTLLAVVISFFVFMISPAKYQIKMTLKTNQVSNPNIQDQVESLEKLTHSKSYEALAEALNIRLEEAQDIDLIQHEVIFPEYVSPDPYDEHLPFRIQAVVRERNMVPELQNAIVRYLEENEFAVINKKLRIRTLEKEFSKIERELEQIEALKKAYLEKLSSTSENVQVKVGNDINPITFHDKSLELYKRSLDVENALSIDENISVVQGFSVSDEADQPKITLHLIWGAIIGFAASFLFFLINMRLQRSVISKE